jgi:hypothetical protein
VLGRWLPLLTCLSGAAVPAIEAIDEDFAPRAEATTLADQLADLLEFVHFQEKGWHSRRAPAEPWTA